MKEQEQQRRQIMQWLALAPIGAAVAGAQPAHAAPKAGKKGKPPTIGIMMHENEDRPIDQTDKSFDFIEIPVEIWVQPFAPQSKWDENYAKLKSWKLPPITVASHFLEGVLPVVGPVVDWELADFWVERSLKRISAIGVKLAGMYGGFWTAPEGFPKNKAIDQTIRLCDMMAKKAKKYGVTLALEPQADPKTLFPRYLEAVEIAKRVGRPEIRVMADTAYLQRLDQPLEDLTKAPQYLAHVQTRGDKGQPGVGNFVEYHTKMFRVLRDIGYEGGVSIAAPWVSTTPGAKMDYRVETGKSYKYLKDIRDRVYAEKTG